MNTITIEEIEQEIEKVTEIARTGTDDVLLKSVDDLKGKLKIGTKIGLKCSEKRIQKKFKILQNALNTRCREKKNAYPEQ